MAAEPEGKSGFPWAVKTGDLATVQECVNAGEDVNQISNDINRQTPMHWAADFGQLEVMQFLVSRGAKPDTPNAFGITPLLAAVYAKHDEAVSYLLSLGVDLSVRGPDGMTAYEAAETASLKKILADAGGASAASAAPSAAPAAAAAPAPAARPPARPAPPARKGLFGFGKK